MRKWIAVLAIGACIGLPAAAQQKDADKNTTTAETATPAPVPTGASNPFAVSKSPWALAATPRLTPFPTPAPAAAADATGPGQLLPKFEVGGGDMLEDFHSGGAVASVWPPCAE